jgi:uncharacterized protein (TIGR00369 family)
MGRRSASLRKIERVGTRELQERLQASGPAQHMGFELAEVSRGRVALRLRVERHHKQVHGVVHGGVLATLADTAGGLASWTTAAGPRVATIEMKINFLEAVEGGTVVADARVIRAGKHVSVVDCDIRDDKRLVGKASMSFYVGQFDSTPKQKPRKRRG